METKNVPDGNATPTAENSPDCAAREALKACVETVFDGFLESAMLDPTPVKLDPNAPNRLELLSSLLGMKFTGEALKDGSLERTANTLIEGVRDLVHVVQQPEDLQHNRHCREGLEALQSRLEALGLPSDPDMVTLVERLQTWARAMPERREEAAQIDDALRRLLEL